MNVAGENRRAGAVAAQGVGRGMNRSLRGAGVGLLLAAAGLASPAAAQWLPNFQVYTPTRIGLFGGGIRVAVGQPIHSPSA